ncbi:cytochrome c biogenesis protein ResB [Streptomyces sp. ActVer]|uniref:cytochrome c biogenesis protein ResB n=1 Tax=Streptomyces sp. ActVer TaxID=3014558 RepID=UPI0022B4B600|nr:cytochrome c biogenesis protein ResB [Streptomyces sp. ActVer]MCZ4510399.1 cytochrome c biogenesis protein ResB [Streptomyces sp. ActVer]
MSTTRDTDVRTGGEAAASDAGGEAAVARDAGELGEAGAQLSTAPRETVVPGSFGGSRAPGAAGWFAWAGREAVGWARWFWRQLTSMRVALILLFLLSLGAIPGSLIPQSGTDPTKVDDFLTRHTTLGPVYEKLGLFNVYSSAWFSAIYILLFISLVGCIVPRTWQFVGQLRGRPPGAPRRLTRLPAYTTWRTGAEPEAVREEALKLLKRRRFRAHLAGDAVAAEKGYLREVGNLAFHIALIVMLIAFAWGQLFKSEGNKLIIEGDGFANTLTQYDDFKSGNLFSTDDLEPFSFVLNKFKGTYERTGPSTGTPRTFEAHVTYSEGADGKEQRRTIKVNKPMVIDDSKVYLVSHGYAPVVTVRDGKGNVVFSQAVPLLPLDSNVTSSGVIKVLDGYRNAKGVKEQLGFNAFFVPTFAGAGKGQMLSLFPALDFPVLALSAYHGDLGVDSGLPQSVYQLDKSNMKQFKDSKGNLLKKRLLPGETMKLPNGAGSITFEKEIKEWAGFQVTEQPGSGWALAGALTAIFGLAASLFIQRRRVWVRATAGPDGVTVVEMAGLGRSESAKVPEELGNLAGILYDLAPGAPDTPDDASDDTPDTGADAKSEPDSDPETKTSTPEPPAVPAAEGAEK